MSTPEKHYRYPTPENKDAMKTKAEDPKETLKSSELSAAETTARTQIRSNAIVLKNAPEKLKLRLGMQKYDDNYPIRMDELIRRPETLDQECLYSDFEEPETGEGAANYPFEGEVALEHAPEIRRHYYLYKLRSYFSRQADVLIYYNFIYDLELWYPVDTTDADAPADARKYKRFNLSVQINDGKALLYVCFNGYSHVHQKAFTEERVFEKAGKFVYKGFVISGKKLHQLRSTRQDAVKLHEVYPVINREIDQTLGLEINHSKNMNPVQEQVTQIQHLRDHVLGSAEFGKAFPYIDKRRQGSSMKPYYRRITKDDIIELSTGHQVALMGNGHQHNVPGHYAKSFTTYGPYQPIPYTQVKVGLVMPAATPKAAIEQIEAKLLPALQSTLGTGFYLIYKLTYSSDEQAPRELDDHLQELSRKGEQADLLLFLIPYKKHEPDPEKRRFYDIMKAIFRDFQLPSQFMHTSLPLSGQSFVFSLPNLSVKICAKLGGIPWRSPYSTDNRAPSMIVGINAYRDPKLKHAYMASMTFFMEDALVMENTGLDETNPELLASAIRKAIRAYQKSHPNAARIVIHLHKVLSHEDNKKIIRAIEALGNTIEVYFVMVKAQLHRKHFFWDVSRNDKLARSGMVVKLPDGSYLLNINRQFKRSDKPDTYPFPLRLKIWKIGPDEQGKATVQHPHDKEKKAVLSQLVRMSVISWRSVRPATSPASVSYPKTLARRYREFPEGFKIVGPNQLFEGI